MTTTENCAECGNRAAPGLSFCDSCGSVLSWADRAGAGRGSDAGSAKAGGVPAPAASVSVSVSAAASSAAPTATAVASGPAVGAAAGAAPGALPGTVAGAGGTAFADDPAPAPASAPALASAADAARGVDREPGGGPAARAAAGSVAPAAGDSEQETAPIESVPTEAPATSTPAAGDDTFDRARQLLVPVQDPGPRPAASPSVAPVLPGRPMPQRPRVVQAAGEELGVDGGVPCPWCGTPNGPDRHFCVRCAMPMTRQEQPGAGRSWWRRMLDLRNRETPWAGDRPRLRRTFDRVLSVLGAAIALTLLVVVVADVPKAFQSTKDHFAKRSPVAPDSVSASRSFPGHPARLAFDKWNNTWWGPGVSETGKGQWLQATFDQPTRLLDLIVTSGISTHPDQLQKEALPHRVTATVTTDKGKTFTRELVLDQASGGQRIPFRVGEVTRVRFTIDSAYFADAGKQVAIAEIEFFGPSSRR